MTDFDAFFGAVVTLEAHEMALQMTAIHTFAAMKRPDIAKVSFQYAAEEAEHRVLANYARGARPATDLAFELTFYNDPREHLTFLEEQGIIGGSGVKYTYPGPGEIDTSNVVNTTRYGPMVSCAPAGVLEAGAGGMSGVGDVGWASRESLGVLGVLGLGAAALGLRGRRMTAHREE